MDERTIVFVDEVHRFNRAQQDAFLPHVEAGNILLIGATTENPSFEVIAPLLSRMKVYVLKAHTTGADRDAAAIGPCGIRCAGWASRTWRRPAEILERIAILANGDARAAYNTLEALVMGTAPNARGPPRA